MNQNDQIDCPVKFPSFEERMKALAAPINQRSEQNLEISRAATVEIENADRNKQRYEKLAEASKAEAHAYSLELQELHRSDDPDPKQVYKIRAKRNGCLEDAEIHLSSIMGCGAARASSELKVSIAAANMLSLKSQFLAEGSRIFAEHLTEHLSDLRPMMMFMGMVAEYAQSGDCEYYNARHDLSTPLEFALNQLAEIVRVALKDGIPEEFGSRAFLRELPPGLRQKMLSPLQAMAREKMIADMEAAL